MLPLHHSGILPGSPPGTVCLSVCLFWHFRPGESRFPSVTIAGAAPRTPRDFPPRESHQSAPGCSESPSRPKSRLRRLASKRACGRSLAPNGSSSAGGLATRTFPVRYFCIGSPVPGGMPSTARGPQPPKQSVVRGLGHIESAPAAFGSFPPEERNILPVLRRNVTPSRLPSGWCSVLP